MHVIIRHEGFNKTDVELIADIIKLRVIRKVKSDIRSVRVVFQDLDRACAFW